MSEIGSNIEQSREPLFDTIVVCGMGPVALRQSRTFAPEYKGNENLVATNVMNFFNAISAKLLVSSNISESAIVSGWASQKHEGVDNLTPVQKVEKDSSEADLLGVTYKRAQPQVFTKEIRDQADASIIIEPEARTTFSNIIQALNKLDSENGGYFEGSLAIVSSEFHGPRIAEMIKAFGLENVRFLSAERVLKHFGYPFRPVREFTDPKTGGQKKFEMSSGFGNKWTDFDNSVYAGQPNGVWNLQRNPDYMVWELQNIKSDRRLHEIASGVRDYYQNGKLDSELPEIINSLPVEYDSQYDYSQFREALGPLRYNEIGQIKINYHQEPYGLNQEEAVRSYRESAEQLGKETEELLSTSIS